MSENRNGDGEAEGATDEENEHPSNGEALDGDSWDGDAIEANLADEWDGELPDDVDVGDLSDEHWFERAVDDPTVDDPTVDDPAGEDETGESAEKTGAAVDGAVGSSAGSADDPSDSSADDDDGSLFGEDFASALESVPMPDVDGSVENTDGDGSVGSTAVGGVGDVGGSFGTPTVSDAPGGRAVEADDGESTIPRIDLGIDGLDRMIQGGVPERSLVATIGAAGTGKTTFGIQFLEEGLRNGERGVFITLEESTDRVITSAVEKGIPFDEYVDDGLLAVVDVDPVEMANSLTSIRSELPAMVRDFGATRLVLDSVSLLEMMYEDRATRRNEIYDFTRSLKDAGVTAMLTSEASEEVPHASRYGIVEYLTDAVFVLQYVRAEDFRETRLAIQIQKIRDANHSREMKPYEITDTGISVHRQANIYQ